MPRKPEKIGERYGRLVVVEHIYGTAKYRCKCDCGNVVDVYGQNLNRNDKNYTKSCGCLAREESSKRLKKSIKFYNGTSISNISSKRNYKTNTSGKRGVFWDKSSCKWRACLMIKGKRYWLGSYVTKDEAIMARKVAEDRYYKPVISAYESCI